MKLAIYDKNPGKGVGQWFLKLSWVIGCFLFKLFGAIDEYKGVGSREELYGALVDNKPVTSLQYWGHGLPGLVYVSGAPIGLIQVGAMLEPLAKDATVWFRTCSTFQGPRGQALAKYLANKLNCRVYAHTRIIGLFQGGLHSIKPGEQVSWPIEEGEVTGFLPRYFASMGLWPGKNTVFCLKATPPKDW